MVLKPSRFIEIAKFKINDSRNLVVSLAQNDSIVIAQQLEVLEGKKKHNIFLQGAIELADKEAVTNLRDALNICLSSGEPQQTIEK